MDESDNMTLTSINKYLEQHGKTLTDYYLPNIAITLGMDDTCDFEYEAERIIYFIWMVQEGVARHLRTTI